MVVERCSEGALFCRIRVRFAGDQQKSFAGSFFFQRSELRSSGLGLPGIHFQITQGQPRFQLSLEGRMRGGFREHSFKSFPRFRIFPKRCIHPPGNNT